MLRLHSIIIVLFFLLSGCSSKEPDRYYNSKDNYSVKFPKEWENKENFMGCSIVSLSPKLNDADMFRENVNVAVEQLPQGMGLNEYFDASVPTLAKVITDFQENEKGTTAINDNDAKWLIYSGRVGTTKLKCEQFYIVHDKHGYVITCSATPESYSDYKKIFEEAAHSFEFE